MKCEICGGAMHGEGFLIEVEGAKLTVCARCKRFGQETKKHLDQLHAPPTRVPVKTPLRASPTGVPVKTPLELAKRNARPKPIKESPKSELQEYELVEDYPQRIRRARESLKATQIELAKRMRERLSIIQKLETGKMWPSDSLVEKIERTLHITLRAPVSDDSITRRSEKLTSELTIGDVADTVVRKKPS